MSTLRLTGLVIALAVIFIAASTITAISTLTQIPNANITPTASENANAPAFAVEVEARVTQADPSGGEDLFKRYGCATCHGMPNGAGPYVVGLGQRASTRRPGYSAAAYLYESITQPNAYIVKDYPIAVMP